MSLRCGVLFGLAVALAVSFGYASEEALDPAKARKDTKDAVLWYDAQLLPLEGKGWTDTKAPYDRLPAKAEGKVRDAVWSLSRHSAGMCVRFVTDAPAIWAQWSLTSSNLAMPHMPASGVSGLDLYVQTEEGWRWVATGRPAAQANRATLVSGIEPKARHYMVYLPLYNGTASLEIGVPEGAKLMRGPARSADQAKPLVFYGTSITHGASASRPGMVHTALLGRWFDRPVINLGFSGNGRMEAEVAELLTELDAAVYIIDCLPNITAPEVRERTEPLVRILRKARPDTPILLVEDRDYTDGFLVTSKRERNRTSQAALREAYDRLIATGEKSLYYLEGPPLLGDDGEGTVDSSHPTDLGFMRQAQAFRKALEPILDASAHGR
jgi:hypothetical protein